MKLKFCMMVLLLVFCCSCTQAQGVVPGVSSQDSRSGITSSVPVPSDDGKLPERESYPSPGAPGGRICLTDDGTISFRFGDGWLPAEENGPFDLQCVAHERGLTTGVFCYTRENAPMQWDPAEALDFHVEDIKSQREEVAVLEAKASAADAAHRYTTVLLEGGLDGKRFCYYFTLIEFVGFSERFAVVVQTAEKDTVDREGVVEFDAINASSALLANTPADGGGRSI